MQKATLRLSFVLTLSFVNKILTSHAQPSLTQYLQLAGVGSNGPPAPLPPTHGPPGYTTSNYNTPGYQQNYPNSPTFQNPQSYQSPPRPLPSPSVPVPLSSIANLASIPHSNPPPPKPPAVSKSKNVPSSGLDANVLNNLAIALQLLIVSNILSTPPADTPEPFSKFELSKYESIPKYDSVPFPPIALSYPVQGPMSLQSIPFIESPRSYSYESQSLPNANFLGASTFIEPAMFGSAISPARPNPRSSMTLMSPYEAIGPNSPFSDPILSSAYSPTYSKSPARPNPRSSMTLMSPYEAIGPNSPFSDPILSSAYSPTYSKSPARPNPRSSMTLMSPYEAIGPNSPFSDPILSSAYSPTYSKSPARPNPRSSMTLMSPYEAIGPNSPFSDPILSSAYSPTYSKKDFQSPYASILAADGHRDLFSVSDLF